MPSFLKKISSKINKPKRIIFPESNSKSIIQAAYQAYQSNICLPYFVDRDSGISDICRDLEIETEGWYTLLFPAEYVDELIETTIIKSLDLPEQALRFLLEEPLYFSAAYLRTDKVDAMIAGFDYTTGEVVSAGNMFLSKANEHSLVSSFFVMDIPKYSGSEDNLLVFSDCGVNVAPTSTELSKIAIDTVHSVETLLGWEPKVAFLSSSTQGSIDHENVDKIKEALQLFRKENPSIKVAGEMQADAALNQEIADKKFPEKSEVAGKANILIFPTLDSGNIAYKLVSQLANATAYGPILQGLAKPLFDLSRGSSVDEIVGVINISAVLANSGDYK